MPVDTLSKTLKEDPLLMLFHLIYSRTRLAMLGCADIVYRNSFAQRVLILFFRFQL